MTALALIFGPKSVAASRRSRSTAGVPSSSTPDPTTLGLWTELLAYLRGHGHRHLYYAKLDLSSKTVTLSEGHSIQLHYSR